MQGLYNYVVPLFFETSSSTKTSSNSTVSRKEEGSSIVEFFSQHISRYEHSKAIPQGLSEMKRILLISFPHDPLVKKIDDLLKTKLPFSTAIEHFPQSSFFFHSSIQRSLASDVFVQLPHLSIEQTKDALSLAKAQNPISEIKLHNVNDDLLDWLSKNFPNLTSLSLVGNISTGIWEQFTPKGLACISRFPLKKLEIDAWDNLAMLSAESFTDLLSQKQLSDNLEELKLITFWISDENFPILASYKSLKSLEVASAFFSPEVSAKTLSSASLKNSVNKLHFSNSTGFETAISDAVLKEVAGYKHLTDLLLSASDWKAQSSSLQDLLSIQQNNLNHLSLQGMSLDDSCANLIGNMNLKSLALYDCASIQSKLLFQKQNELQRLVLKNISPETLLEIGKLETLEWLSLSLNDSSVIWNQDMQNFCNSEVKKTLKTFHLANFSHLSDFSCLTHLEQLSEVRFDRCRWFNDMSLMELAKSKIAQNINKLEFNEATFSDQTVTYFELFTNLKYLLLANCFALTDQGKLEILSLSSLQKKLFGLSMERFSLNDELIKVLFAPFATLKFLCMSNNDQISSLGEEYLEQLAKIKNFNLLISNGLVNFFDDFQKLIKFTNQ